MRSAAIVQHDDGTPTGSRSTSFFIRGITERAARAAWRVVSAPYVDIAVLSALATLLQELTSVSGAPSQLRDSSAALGSHDANRGEGHAAPANPSSPSPPHATSVHSFR